MLVLGFLEANKQVLDKVLAEQYENKRTNSEMMVLKE